MYMCAQYVLKLHDYFEVQHSFPRTLTHSTFQTLSNTILGLGRMNASNQTGWFQETSPLKLSNVLFSWLGFHNQPVSFNRSQMGQCCQHCVTFSRVEYLLVSKISFALFVFMCICSLVEVGAAP